MTTAFEDAFDKPLTKGLLTVDESIRAHPPPRPDHAKAELALRFLEFYEQTVVVKTFKPEMARRIHGCCWVIISEYFRP